MQNLCFSLSLFSPTHSFSLFLFLLLQSTASPNLPVPFLLFFLSRTAQNPATGPAPSFWPSLALLPPLSPPGGPRPSGPSPSSCRAGTPPESGRRSGAASPAPLARTSRGTPPLFKQGPAPLLEPYQVEAVALHAQTLAAIVEAPPDLGVAAAPLFRRSPHEFEPAWSFALRWGFS